MSLSSCELCQLYEDCKTSLDCQAVVGNVVEKVVMMHTPSNIIEFDPEALKQDIQEYKHIVLNLKNENNLLKVKLRRMEDIVKKKQKIVDTHYLGTHNKLLVKEAVHQFSHRIEALQNDNQDLREESMAKDLIIRKLRRKLHSYSAYKPPAPPKKKTGPASARSRSSRNTDHSETTSNVDPTTEDLTIEEITEDVLVKMKTIKLNNNESNSNCTNGDSELEEDQQQNEHDTERAVNCSLLLDSPHEEIEKLHTGFKDILSEVGKLKDSMSQIHEHHTRTVCEMRIREKLLLSQLYDKRTEPTYRASTKPAGFAQSPLTAIGEKPRTQQTKQNTKPPVAFVRITPAPKPVKTSPKRRGKYAGLGILTASKNSLHDETDMRLYIDEVLHDMNRHK